MQLKEFSLISPEVELDTVLKALETAIPPEAIEQAMGDKPLLALAQTNIAFKSVSVLYHHIWSSV